MENGYHYQIIGRALDYVRDVAPRQPSLEELAEVAGLSPFHFQRVFSEWVGVSPKNYVQHFALAHAKSMLAGRISTFDAATNAGLSGTGRLYDLIVKWEGVRPGDVAKSGRGLRFSYAFAPTRFGEALFIGRDERLVALGFVGLESRDEVLQDYKNRWPQASFEENGAALATAIQAVQSMSGEVRLSLIGTEFQLAIWRALLAIPEGAFSSYSEISQSIGKPKAQRAAGSAIGKNPIALLVPCHRVIRETGALGGYRWGLPTKEALITFEAARSEKQPA